jgi:hypothetical protein
VFFVVKKYFVLKKLLIYKDDAGKAEKNVREADVIFRYFPPPFFVIIPDIALDTGE